MAKFKIGDKVKIVNPIGGFCHKYQDHIVTIKGYTKTNVTNEFAYTVKEDGPNSYVWQDKELELVPLTIEEKRDKLIEFCNGKSCIGCKLENYVCGFDGWGLKDEKVDEAYSIVFEQGEKDMNKFTKKDLKNGDVVKFKNGETAIAVVDIGTFVFKDGYLKFDDVAYDLTYSSCIQGDKYTVIAVRRPTRSSECHLDLFKVELGQLVFERKEVEEMTLEEVCKALGKEIKIVKEKN